MEEKKLKKGIFQIIKPNAKVEPSKGDSDKIIKDAINEEPSSRITLNQYGFEQAGRLGGTIPGLKVMLPKIFHDYRQAIKDDKKKQEDLQRPYKIKIEEYSADIEGIEGKIERIDSVRKPKIQEKIQVHQHQISHVRRNPQEVAGDNAVNASFYVGLIILSFLTVYLFVFYSSASYSAFFKEFSLNEIGVANSIFDARALSKALKDGVTELALILTIPFVFLGLGYLIHKFQEQTSKAKYFKIFVLIFITFVFDSILAYEITEKIYDIERDNSFELIAEYTVSMAYSSINFWLIIFAGFVVYIIWGFVFDFVIDASSKLDKVKIALEDEQKMIEKYESDLINLNREIEDLNHEKGEKVKEKRKLMRIIENPIIPRSFEQDIFSFLAGWMSYMRQSGSSAAELNEAQEFTHNFVEERLSGFVNLNEE